MLLYEKTLRIDPPSSEGSLLEYFKSEVLKNLEDNEKPIRFVVTRSDHSGYHCEVGILSSDHDIEDRGAIFDFRKRTRSNINSFNVVLVIPTGVGAEVGGDSGDACSVARFVASNCDTLITHPNVVNAADINELPSNGLYVEGSVLARFLMGTVALEKVRSNRVVVIADDHADKFMSDATVNSVSAARATLGLNCTEVILMQNPVSMRALYSNSGRAVGSIDKLERLVDKLRELEGSFDAVALSSVIKVPKEFHLDYFRKEMINPWGGVEAMLTHTISTLFNVQSAHSPMMESRDIMNLDVGVVHPTKSAEAVSTTYMHCILKGLHNAPKIHQITDSLDTNGLLDVSDVSCLIIPERCLGLPTLAALQQGIPVIAVRDTKNRMLNDLKKLPLQPEMLLVAENYLEAVGIMRALKIGVSLESLRRPLSHTKVTKSRECANSSTPATTETTALQFGQDVEEAGG